MPEIQYIIKRLDNTDALSTAFPSEGGDKFDTNRDCVWVLAIDDDRVIGCCCMEMRGPGVWYYKSGFVAPTHRRQGIYKAMFGIRDMLAHVYKAHTVFGISSPMNRTLFEKEGWTPICRYDYSLHFDEVVFFKNLSDEKAVMKYPETEREHEHFGSNEGLVGPKNSIIGFWPTPETTDNNWQYIECSYRALACTYQMDMQLVSEPEDIVVADRRPWVSIEEYREGVDSTPYTEFEYPEEAIYLSGNSEHRHMSDIFTVDHVLTIPTPGGYDEPLYGSQAMAIVLQDRFIKAGQPVLQHAPESGS